MYLLSQIEPQTPVTIIVSLQELWQLCQINVPQVCFEKLHIQKQQQQLICFTASIPGQPSHAVPHSSHKFKYI